MGTQHNKHLLYDLSGLPGGDTIQMFLLVLSSPGKLVGCALGVGSTEGVFYCNYRELLDSSGQKQLMQDAARFIPISSKFAASSQESQGPEAAHTRRIPLRAPRFLAEHNCSILPVRNTGKT